MVRIAKDLLLSVNMPCGVEKIMMMTLLGINNDVLLEHENDIRH